MAPVRQALADAKLTPAEIEEVVLVGARRVFLSCGVRSKNSLTHSARGAQPDEVVALARPCRLTSSKAA